MHMEFGPIENVEAARAIAGKTAVGRAVFDKLLPELKARAFAVTGLEDLRMVRAVRDAIAELPKGQSWEKVSKQVREKLEEGGFSEKESARRAELLVRHHGFQAYAQADYAVKQETKESFPYWKYQTMGDGHVRSSHAALDGLVLPADDPFWEDHYPPWEWGCRCQVIAIDEDEYQEMVDAGRVAGDRRFQGSEDQRGEGWTIGPEARKTLEKGTLDDGTGHPVDVRSPRVAKGSGAYGWTPGESSMKASDLHRRYAEGAGKDAERDWEGFYRQMEGVKIEDEQGRKRPIWDWVIRGDVMEAAKEVLRRTGESGMESGIEYLAVVDYKTGERFGETVKGTSEGVSARKLMEEARTKETPVAMVHSHPKTGGVPSPADVGYTLKNADILKTTGVVEWEGMFHELREGETWRRMSAMERSVALAELEIYQEAMPYKMWVDTLENWDTRGIIEHETTQSI